MSDVIDKPRTLFLGPGRLSFPNLLKPQTNDEGKDSYNCVVLLPPSFDLGPLRRALIEAGETKWGRDRKKWPITKTFRDVEDVIVPCEGSKWFSGEEFKGWHSVNCARLDRPEVVGPVKGEDGRFPRITDPDEVYPGRWARVSVNAYAFQNKKAGLTFGLNNVQLLKHDGKLAGKPRAEAEFDEWEDDEEGGW